VSTIPDDVIEQVRDAADLVAVIGEHVELRRTGSDYRGPCPFHGGKHRNFAVIPKKQMFYCFVCHEAGDVFTFFMKRLGMDYPTAVREVARRVGVTIPERRGAGPDPREPLFTAVSAAGEWYARHLRDADDAKSARRYLEERSFDLEKLLPLGLGFAPKGSEFLKGMEQLGVKTEVLMEAGLAVKREDGSLRPRFWNRLLFPIHDLRGRVVGFGGRVLGDAEPKYLNSPDTPVFHKGSLLYNLHDAKHAIRKAERAVVVEGYFDALRLVEVGIEETVAPLGTSLTPEQAKLLKRYTKSVVLLYDNDAAGLRASFRAADVLLHTGLRVLIATPPPGQDPDAVALSGGIDAVCALLDDALDVFERKLQLLERKGWLGSLSGRRRALDRLLPTLRAVSDGVTRDLYVNRAAEALGISRESVLQELKSGRWSAPRPPEAAGLGGGDAPQARPGRVGRPERDLLRVMLHEVGWRERIVERLAELESEDTPERRLLEHVGGLDAKVVGGEVLNHVAPEDRGLLTELLVQQWGDLNVDAMVDGALRKIESRALVVQLRAIDRQITVASEEEKVELSQQKETKRRSRSAR
jgi:DNA primase